MMKKRTPKNDEHEAEDRGAETQRRRQEIAAEDQAIDAMIQRSLKLHGA
jgi:hypothetical protein